MQPQEPQNPTHLEPAEELEMYQPENFVAEPARMQQAAPSDQPEDIMGPEETEPVRWQATEYIHREKDHLWFVLFGLVTIVFIVVAIFVMKSLTFAILVPVMAVALFIYTRRPPRVLNYALGRHGLYINDQLFPYSSFKAFALVHGMEQYTILLVPIKRFKPGVSINFPEEAGEVIVDTLAARLPMREAEPDLVDRLIHKLHL